MHVRYLPLSLSLLLPAGLVLYGAGRPLAQSHKSAAAKQTKSPQTAPTKFTTDVAPLVSKFCVGCHGAKDPAAGISLAAFSDAASALKARDIWERVARNVGDSHMPPEGMPKPTDAERARLVAAVNGMLGANDCNLHDPGRVTMRRLNRTEYNNTIRDLFGMDLHPADAFPNDDVGYGFDNIGDVLSLSPLLMEKYLAAAEKITQTAILTPETTIAPITIPASSLAGVKGTEVQGNGCMLFSEAEIGKDLPFPSTGQYTIRVHAYGQQAGPEPAKMAIRLDGHDIQKVDVTAEENAPGTYAVRLPVTAGNHRLAVAFLNDYYNPMDPDPKRRDRNLYVDSLEVHSPRPTTANLSGAQKRIFFVHPTTPASRAACARRILAAFARRAYRRPATAQEVDRLTRYALLAMKDGASFERGIQFGLQAILVSPNFLFRVESNPASIHKVTNKTGLPLNDYELASRLSYFLWSTMPDDELFALAAKGTLQQPAVLIAQVRRMLKDPKADALAANFAGQWLQLRKLNNVFPDKRRFPDFNNAMRDSMRRETELFFSAIVREDRSVLDFLDGKYTYVNGPLAKHYGIPNVEGDQFRRVALTDDARGGILTQASVLTVTSNPTRTSPVKRGKWVMEQLLNSPIPPPPPGVGNLPDDKKQPLVGTLRQRMEQHRANPACAACHARMDPIGFGLENFDAVGGWRDKDGDAKIDASGVLPDGKTFRGPAELRAILLSKKEQFVRCLTEKMLTYALGRGVETTDNCNVNAMAATVAKHDYKFSSLIVAIVESDPFRKRRGAGGS